MSKTRHLMAVSAGLAAVTLAVAGCGSSSNSSGESSSSSGGETASGGTTKVKEVPFESLEQKVPTSYPQPKPGHYKLAYMNPSPGNQFLLEMGTAMKLETEKLGGSYIEVSAKEPNEQVSELSQLIAEKVNGIAVFALDPKSLAPEVKKAREAGIKLATIDLNMTETSEASLGGYETQVWQGRDYGAYTTAKYMAEHLEPGAEIGEIEFAIKVPSIVFSVERDKYWAEKFGLKVAGATANQTDDIAGGEPAMTQLLNKYPGIKGVMAYNDPSAIGAYSAARSAGTTGLLLCGENGASEARAAIKSEHESCTAAIDAPAIGKDWAWGLYDLNEGKKVAPTIASRPTLVTKENVESVPTWDEVLQKEYGKTK